jgi:hypothetical protein
MRFLFLFIFSFSSIFSFAQDAKKKFYDMLNPLKSTIFEIREPVDLKKKIGAFINKVNKENNSKKKILYVIRVYEYDSIDHNYSFSMSYILNSIEYDIVKPTHYFMIRENAIILSPSYPNVESVFTKCGIKIIGKEEIELLSNYLYPCSNGKMQVIYEPQGMTYCKKRENVKITYYPYVGNMPGIAQIYLTNPMEIPEYLDPDYIPPQFRDGK